MADPFVLGVNYWPRRKAMYWWANFEEAEVREEFRQIRSFGMSVVRIFLLWDDWMPTPDAVSPECLRNLKTGATEDRGEVPDLTTIGNGCPFAPRCRHVMDVCRQAMPPRYALEDGRWTRCYLYDGAPTLEADDERQPVAVR